MKILLNEILYKRKLSFRQAEIMTGISKSSLSDIANGKSDPRMSVMEQIAKGLSVRISDLYESEFK